MSIALLAAPCMKEITSPALNTARSIFSNFLSEARCSMGKIVPDDDAEALVWLFLQFVANSNGYDLDKLFRARIGLEMDFALLLHEYLLTEKAAYDDHLIRPNRSVIRKKLNSLVRAMSELSIGDWQSLMDLEMQFHSQIAIGAGFPAIGDFILELRESEKLIGLYKTFKKRDFRRIVNDHKRLFDGIVDPETTDAGLKEIVFDHIVKGAALEKLLALAHGSDRSKVQCMEAFMCLDAENGFDAELDALKSELLIEYKSRLRREPLAKLPADFLERVRSEIDWIFEECGKQVSVEHFDTVFERMAITHAYRDTNYLLITWSRSCDDIGRLRSTAEFVAECECWADIIGLRQKIGSKIGKELEILTPAADLDEVCSR